MEVVQTDSAARQGLGLSEAMASVSTSWWFQKLIALLYWAARLAFMAESRKQQPHKDARAAAAARAAKQAAAEATEAAVFEAKRPADPSPPAAAPWRFSNVSIHTLEHVDAPVVVTSKESMQRLGWRLRLAGVGSDILERLSGIKERRMWEQGTTGVQAATWAARKALESSGIPPSRIGVICNTSVWRDYLEPGMAVCVHHELGLAASCLNLDVTNACCGMVNGMLTVASMIEAGVCDYGLVVNAELMQDGYEQTIARMRRTFSVQELRNSMAALTIGSGSVAAILCRSDLAPPGRNHRLTGAVSRCAPYARDMCTASYERFTVNPKLVVHGSFVIRQTWEVAKAVFGWSPDNIDLCVPHQVSSKVKALGIAMTGISEDKCVFTYPYLGNIGPASIFIALSKAQEQRRLREGSRVALLSIGSGINCIMAEVIW